MSLVNRLSKVSEVTLFDHLLVLYTYPFNGNEIMLWMFHDKAIGFFH